MKKKQTVDDADFSAPVAPNPIRVAMIAECVLRLQTDGHGRAINEASLSAL
jgi:uncharacterized protein YlaI